jgi:hypothetical protein
MHWKLTLSVAVFASLLLGCAQEPAKPSKTHLGVEPSWSTGSRLGNCSLRWRATRA